MAKSSSKYLSYFFYFLPLIIMLIISSSIIIGFIVACVIDWTWITGWFLGTTIAFLGWYLFTKATQFLVVWENHYMYYFFFLLRVGLYFVTFLISYILIDAFSIYGTIIGLAPVIVLPFCYALKGFIDKKMQDRKLKTLE